MAEQAALLRSLQTAARTSHTHTHSERSKVVWFTLTSLDGALLMVKLLEDSSSNRSLKFDLSAQIIIKNIYIYHHGNKMDDNKSRCWRC